MKPLLHIILLLATWLLFPACNKAEHYQRRTAALDSLGGAIHTMTAELQKPDTLVLQKIIARFSYYRQFIEQNIRDTITKEAADHLQHFYHSGGTLQDFTANRPAILQRAALMTAQHQKLAEDIRNRALPLEELDLYLERERREAGKLITAGSQQQQACYRSMEEFRLSVGEVEKLIRLHNNGELPLIIKDTVDL